MPFDGASFEHRSHIGLAEACLALPCSALISRSPRPGVSPSCP